MVASGTIRETHRKRRRFHGSQCPVLLGEAGRDLRVSRRPLARARRWALSHRWGVDWASGYVYRSLKSFRASLLLTILSLFSPDRRNASRLHIRPRARDRRGQWLTLMIAALEKADLLAIDAHVLAVHPHHAHEPQEHVMCQAAPDAEAISTNVCRADGRTARRALVAFTRRGLGGKNAGRSMEAGQEQLNVHELCPSSIHGELPHENRPAFKPTLSTFPGEVWRQDISLPDGSSSQQPSQWSPGLGKPAAHKWWKGAQHTVDQVNFAR